MVYTLIFIKRCILHNLCKSYYTFPKHLCPLIYDGWYMFIYF